MAANEVANGITLPQTKETKTEPGEFYGYNHYIDAAGRFLGEEKAGSRKFHVFGSKKIFESAVTEYNILGNPAVKSAAIGPA